MSRRVLLFVLVVLIIASCILGVMSIQFKSVPASSLYYYRISDRLEPWGISGNLPDVFTEAIGKQYLIMGNFAQTELLMFETLNYVDQLMKKVPYPLSIKYVYGVCGSDLMANKGYLADTLYKKYGSDAHDMIPTTYLLDSDSAIQQIKNEFDPSNVYILKKNIQRQEGYLLTRNLHEILQNRNEYVVCQKMLQNPYLVNGRKINLRIYLLVMIKHGNVSFYYFDNGFLYYTPLMFKPASMNPGEVITTGYIDRQVYKENPMTLRDLEQFLGETKYDKLMISVHMLLKKVKMAYQEKLRAENAGLPGVKFLVYGCDVAPDSDLHVQLMEINKGPDLNYKDDRDKAVKLTMVRQVMNLVGITQGDYKSLLRV